MSANCGQNCEINIKLLNGSVTNAYFMLYCVDFCWALDTTDILCLVYMHRNLNKLRTKKFQSYPKSTKIDRFEQKMYAYIITLVITFEISSTYLYCFYSTNFTQKKNQNHSFYSTELFLNLTKKSNRGLVWK